MSTGDKANFCTVKPGQSLHTLSDELGSNLLFGVREKDRKRWQRGSYDAREKLGVNDAARMSNQLAASLASALHRRPDKSQEQASAHSSRALSRMGGNVAMPIELRETIVTPGNAGDVVRIRISDVPLDDKSSSFELTILAELPPYQAPALAQLQREAIKLARDVLHEMVQELTRELQQGGHMALGPKGK